MVKFIFNKVKKSLGSKTPPEAAPANTKRPSDNTSSKQTDTKSKSEKGGKTTVAKNNDEKKSGSSTKRSKTSSPKAKQRGQSNRTSSESGEKPRKEPSGEDHQSRERKKSSGQGGHKSQRKDGEQSSRDRKRSGNRKRRSDHGGGGGRSQKTSPRTPENPKLKKTDWNPEDYVVAIEEGKTRFHDLELPESIMHALYDLGFQYCTPIQAGILPQIMGTEQDGMGKAQTGTGKTAAFLLSAFTRLLANPVEGDRRPGTPRVLVLAPTRELVLQIEEEAQLIGKYTGLKSIAVYGGLDYEKQRETLKNNVIDIVCATPGRLIDFNRSRNINLRKVEILVIDEADRMLDMGFIPDVKRIVHSTPHKDERQTFFFSATFNDDVERLASQWTKNPVRVEIEPENVAAETVDQRVYLATDDEKLKVVYNLIQNEKPERVLIFANRRDQVRKLCETLDRYGMNCAILSGDVPQAKRVKTLARFKEGTVPVLVATDVAGRGIHVDGVSHVINYTLPDDAEDYVHRIGRTGRAGAEGHSISFASQFDAFVLPEIEEYIGRELESVYPPDELLIDLPPAPPPKPRPKRSDGGQNRNGERGRSGGQRRGSGGNRRRKGGSSGQGSGGNRPKRSDHNH